jgi:hypothetical protein
MMSASSFHAGPPPRSTAAWVLLLYDGGAGPPHLQRHGCTMLVGMAARGCGRRDLEGCPLRCATRASAMVGGVLHPRQAVAYTRGRSTTVALDLELAGLDLGSHYFFIIKNWSLVLANIISRHQRYDVLCRATAADIKDELFFMSHKGYWIWWPTIKIGYPITKTVFIVVFIAVNQWLVIISVRCARPGWTTQLGWLSFKSSNSGN